MSKPVTLKLWAEPPWRLDNVTVSPFGAITWITRSPTNVCVMSMSMSTTTPRMSSPVWVTLITLRTPVALLSGMLLGTSVDVNVRVVTPIPLLRPQSMDLLLHGFDRDTGEIAVLTQPHWFATTPTAEADLYVAPSTGSPICRRFDALTLTTIKALIETAFAAQKSGSYFLTWKEIRAEAVEVRLPDVFAERNELSLEVTRGEIRVNVERRLDGAWVRGPKSPADALPLKLSMTGGDYVPNLDITTYWSLWAPGGAGEGDLNRVIDALITLGWVRCI